MTKATKSAQIKTVLSADSLAAARARGTALSNAPTAVVHAEFSLDPRGIALVLRSGLRLFVPAKALPVALRRASDAELQDIEVAATRDAVWFSRMDEGFNVASVLVSLLGDVTRREINRAAGRTSSGKKAAAARKNGRKGGRPRKVPRVGS